MQRLGFKTKQNKFQLYEALTAHRQERLPGGWQLTCETEPYYKKEKPTRLTLKKGAGPLAYAPWFEVQCEDGSLHLGFHDSWPLRVSVWAAAALALALMFAARLLPPPYAQLGYWGCAVLALGLLVWDFTRARRAQTAVSQFVRQTILGQNGPAN